MTNSAGSGGVDEGMDHREAYAAWLGGIVERLARGVVPETDAWGGSGGVFANIERMLAGPAAGHASAAGPPRPESPVFSALFREIHRLTRGRPHEAIVWREALVFAQAGPPGDVVEDLIERGVDDELLGHMGLEDRFLWRLAGKVPEALLTLALRRYQDPAESVDRLEEVLHAFPKHDWMLGTLIRRTPSSDEKAALVARYAVGLPADRLAKHWKAGSEVFLDVAGAEPPAV